VQAVSIVDRNTSEGKGNPVGEVQKASKGDLKAAWLGARKQQTKGIIQTKYGLLNEGHPERNRDDSKE
jgi:hypothetical protein